MNFEEIPIKSIAADCNAFFKFSYPYIALDVETTGFRSTDEVIEVAAIEFSLDGKIGDTFHQLCWPESGIIHEKITEINGITIDKVKNSPGYINGGVRDDLERFIAGRKVVGHNVAFDLRFLKIEGLESECTLKLSRELNEEKVSNKLSEVCKRYDIGWIEGNAHSAEYDAFKAMELFCKLRGELW